ncbi:hypothetical protein D4764_03G0001710 [Takifugu flavidus]|uniref:Uncharacterized protein n=1 Tax=Takifugu flavidus TaxID=433684 RepID=A0A5C6N7P3_9TELE|nr:hypothetical protein D4764_03G0001710 [Takifugu flavidus]
MLTMNLEGLEMIAVLVVVVLFVKVLDRFGLLAASYDAGDLVTFALQAQREGQRRLASRESRQRVGVSSTWRPGLDPESQRAGDGCAEAPGLCVRAGVALEWAQGNWSVSLEGEEAGSGSGFGSGHGGADRADGRAMLSSIWETEGLQTVGIVVLVLASIKLLHLLGLISFSEASVSVPASTERDDGGLKMISPERTEVSTCPLLPSPGPNQEAPDPVALPF